MSIEDIQRLVRDNIRRLCPYSTARDEYEGDLGIFLDANESPYPSSWNRYPDPRQSLLRERIAQIKKLNTENVFLGNGSDEAIDLVFRIFCNPREDNVVAISPSYGMYKVAASINDVSVREVSLNKEDFSLPVRNLLDACDDSTKILFLCSPNNPTGNAFSHEDIFTLLQAFKGIVILDEAYVDFSSIPSLTSYLDKYPNLIILQTFSKARGLAALRLGMAFSNPYIISLMMMVKYPYNINASTQQLALEALNHPIEDQIEEVIAQRERLISAFPSFSFVQKVYPSQANFILIKVDDADALYNHLIRDGIIVRNRNSQPLCQGCLRITIGLVKENDMLLLSLAKFES